MSSLSSDFGLLSVLTHVMTFHLQISTKYDHKNHLRVSCLSRAFSQSWGRAERSTHTSGASRFGSAAVAASALLGWLTACDVSHFRLDSTEHGAPPFFSPSPLSNPVLTHALAVATAMQPLATHAAIRSLT